MFGWPHSRSTPQQQQADLAAAPARFQQQPNMQTDFNAHQQGFGGHQDFVRSSDPMFQNQPTGRYGYRGHQQQRQPQAHMQQRQTAIESQIAHQREIEWQRNQKQAHIQFDPVKELESRLSNLELQFKGVKNIVSRLAISDSKNSTPVQAELKNKGLDYLKTLIIRLTEEVIESKTFVTEIKKLLLDKRGTSDTNKSTSTVELLINELDNNIENVDT